MTPLSDTFTKPIAALRLGRMLEERGISLEPDFVVECVKDKTLVSYDGREIAFDLLVAVPVNMGAVRCALRPGNEFNCVPVDRYTFLATGCDSIFALGDAADLPTSKSGSVAHFAAEVFVDGRAEVHPLGNTATHLPQGLGGLPGMTALATHQMRKQIAAVHRC